MSDEPRVSPCIEFRRSVRRSNRGRHRVEVLVVGAGTRDRLRGESSKRTLSVIGKIFGPGPPRGVIPRLNARDSSVGFHSVGVFDSGRAERVCVWAIGELSRQISRGFVLFWGFVLCFYFVGRASERVE